MMLLNIFSLNLFLLKYLSSRTCFIQANGKYADRLESGKFITIYPSSEHIFIQLLKDLKTIVCKYDDGPYILTDKQWQNSNVFFRYGALKPRFSNEKECTCDSDSSG